MISSIALQSNFSAIAPTLAATNIDAISDWLTQAQQVGDVDATILNLARLEQALDAVQLDDWTIAAESAGLALLEPEGILSDHLGVAHGVFRQVQEDNHAMRRLASGRSTLRLLGIGGTGQSPTDSGYYSAAERLRTLLGGAESQADNPLTDTQKEALFLLLGLQTDVNALVNFDLSTSADSYSFSQSLDRLEESSYRIWHALRSALSLFESPSPRPTPLHHLLKGLKRVLDKAATLTGQARESRDRIAELHGTCSSIPPARNVELDDETDPGHLIAENGGTFDAELNVEETDTGLIIATELTESLLSLYFYWAPQQTTDSSVTADSSLLGA